MRKHLSLAVLAATLLGPVAPAFAAATLEDAANAVFTTAYTKVATTFCATGTPSERDACRSAKIKEVASLLTSRSAALDPAACAAPITCATGKVVSESTAISAANCPLTITCAAPGSGTTSGTQSGFSYTTPGSSSSGSSGRALGSSSGGSSGGLSFGSGGAGGGGSGASSGGGSSGGGVNYGSTNGGLRRGGKTVLGPVQSVGSPQLYTFSPAQADPLVILYSLPDLKSGGSH